MSTNYVSDLDTNEELGSTGKGQNQSAQEQEEQEPAGPGQ
jgi:hypothetical protein